MTATDEGALISSGSSVTEGKDVLFTTAPNPGHEVSYWRVNGALVAGETGLTYTYRNLDRNIAVEVMLKEPDLKVASVASVSTKYVDYGTPFGSVGLPSTIEATLEDGSKVNLAVSWAKGSYDENVAGTYTMEGTLAMISGVVNPDGVKSSAQIVVNEEPDAKVFVSYNPYGKVNWDTYSQNKANFHTHTRESDGGRVPNQVIDLYHGAGYKILSLTDHAYASGHPTTWPWTKWGKDPVQLGMLAVEGNEVSGTDHTGSFFSSYDGSTNDMRTALNEIKSRNGMAVFFHPGRYNRSDSWYQTFYNDFDKTLVGMEVYNQGDRHPGDRAKWDRINALVMPNVVVFGYSNDDMHADYELFRNYQFMLMPTLTEGALRESMLNGAFYFSYEPGGSGNINPPVPRISRIEVTSGGTIITISATNTSSVTWRTDKGVAGTGASIDLKTLDLEGAKFIRAELQNGSGKSYTQPFVLQSN